MELISSAAASQPMETSPETKTIPSAESCPSSILATPFQGVPPPASSSMFVPAEPTSVTVGTPVAPSQHGTLTTAFFRSMSEPCDSSATPQPAAVLPISMLSQVPAPNASPLPLLGSIATHNIATSAEPPAHEIVSGEIVGEVGVSPTLCVGGNTAEPRSAPSPPTHISGPTVAHVYERPPIPVHQNGQEKFPVPPVSLSMAAPGYAIVDCSSPNAAKIEESADLSFLSGTWFRSNIPLDNMTAQSQDAGSRIACLKGLEISAQVSDLYPV
eukprot:CAMPEP_0114269310 /NCGR_PEP_ID=MMETSP0058-20121206/26539_1 /TAXON_ID=36894 /ORGANISM="Pyramimonas parkeae, CCMP726" /LENGTH=270 /DNA_ID=CAMNT_0001387777 /DNA_START=203 /DNA_END=1016 /DNA_ORIENTATION=+